MSDRRAPGGGRTGLSNREALVAVLVALAVGVIGSLALRDPAQPEAASSAKTSEASLRWRVHVAFGTNLPALHPKF